MSIEQYIRSLTSKHIRDRLILDKCEMCDCDKNLHLHHVTPFAVMIKHAHDILDIEYGKYSEYTEVEIDILSNYMLGLQLQSQFMTLCDECHTIVHSEDEGGLQYVAEQSLNNTEVKRERKLKAEKMRIETVLVPYLEDDVNSVMLMRKDRKQLIDLINCRNPDNNTLVKSIDTLNQKLCDNNIPYRIEQFSTSRSRGGIKRNYNSAWRIVPN